MPPTPEAIAEAEEESDGDEPKGSDGPGGYKDLRQKWEDTQQTIAQIARLRGSEAAGLVEMLDRTEPVLDWYSIMERWLLDCHPADFSEYEYDRRFMSQGIYMEAVNKPVMDAAVMATDTSGSMNTGWLVQSKSEIQYALKAVGIKRCWVLDIDAELKGDIKEYGPNDDIDFSAKGRGGTDFRPPFRWVDEECPVTPSCFIYFTDGWGPFPEKAPPYPVLWVTFGLPPEQYPFGEVLDLRGLVK